MRHIMLVALFGLAVAFAIAGEFGIAAFSILLCMIVGLLIRIEDLEDIVRRM